RPGSRERVSGRLQSRHVASSNGLHRHIQLAAIERNAVHWHYRVPLVRTGQLQLQFTFGRLLKHKHQTEFVDASFPLTNHWISWCCLCCGDHRGSGHCHSAKLCLDEALPILSSSSISSRCDVCLVLYSNSTPCFDFGRNTRA